MDNKVNKNMFLLIKTYLIGPYWTIRNNYMVASSATKNPDLFIDLDVYAGFDWHIPLLWYWDRMESLYQTLCLDPSHGTWLNDLTYSDQPQIGLNGSAIP